MNKEYKDFFTYGESRVIDAALAQMRYKEPTKNQMEVLSKLGLIGQGLFESKLPRNAWEAFMMIDEYYKVHPEEL